MLLIDPGSLPAACSCEFTKNAKRMKRVLSGFELVALTDGRRAREGPHYH